MLCTCVNEFIQKLTKQLQGFSAKYHLNEYYYWQRERIHVITVQIQEARPISFLDPPRFVTLLPFPTTEQLPPPPRSVNFSTQGTWV